MKLNILFVEDDNKLRGDLVKIFNNEVIANHTLIAEEAESFDKGINLIQQKDYDLVILDLYKGEPREENEKLGLKVLKEIQSLAFIPVIFFSGLTKNLEGIESEIVGVVNKGHGGIDKLKEEIKRIIESNIALIKKKVYEHIRVSLRDYFWKTVHENKTLIEPIKHDISLGYLLLRRIANSLSKENIKSLLGDNKIKDDKSHPMEFYIYPTNNEEYEAGEIISKTGVYYAILTPSCDFIQDKTSGRERKVGQVLLAVASPLTKNNYYLDYKKNSNDKNNRGRLEKLIESRKGDQFFFLPGTPFLENLVLDFQHKIMVHYDDLQNYQRIAKLDDPYAQSMISSFIRYYNRIGFPDIDASYVLSKL